MTTRSAIVLALAVFGLGLPVSSHADGQFTLGAQGWRESAPEAKYQEFRQVPRGPFLESFFVTDSTARGNRFAVHGANVFERNQSAALMAARGIRLRADLNYRQIPHLFSEITRTPYVELTPGVFRLPDSLQLMNQRTASDATYARNMRDVLNNSARLPLGFRTDISDARLRARPITGLQFELRGDRRLRAGNKAYGATFGFSNAIELVEPLDQRMIDADAIANYTRNRLTLRADAGVSAFDNRVSTLRWDNPKRFTDTTGTPSQGQLDLYPDNRLYRGNVSLGLRLPARSVFTATVGATQGTQDDPWLPFTVNSALAQSRIDSLPGRSTDAKSNSYSQDYRLTSRLTNAVSGTLRFRGYQYDNKTPVHEFSGQAIADQSWAVEEVSNSPFSNRQNVWGADADLDLIRGVGLSGTYEYRQRRRTLRESNSDNENFGQLRARLSPVPDVELVASGSYGNRKLTEFDSTAYLTDTGAQEEQPGLRRFDIANRKQSTADAALTWSPGDRLDLMLQYAFLQNRYPDSRLGLQKERNDQVTAEATVHMSDRMEVSGGYGFGKLKTNQASRQSGATVSLSDTSTWTAELEDQSVFAFAHSEWRPAAKLTFSGDYVFSHAKGEFHLANHFRPTAQNLPDTHFDRHTVSVEARYKLLDNTDIGARYGYDDFEINDFSSQGIPLLGLTAGATGFTTSGLFLGNNTQGYRAHAVAVVATRRF